MLIWHISITSPVNVRARIPSLPPASWLCQWLAEKQDATYREVCHLRTPVFYFCSTPPWDLLQLYIRFWKLWQWFLRSCVTQLFVTMSKIPDKSNSEEERFVSAHVFRSSGRGWQAVRWSHHGGSASACRTPAQSLLPWSQEREAAREKIGHSRVGPQGSTSPYSAHPSSL